MYLIFDTETTGLPKNWRAPISDTENWPRCVQLAWQVHDELGNLIESKSFIVKPDDYDIPFESEKIHGISTLLAEKEGVNLDDILNEFNESISKSKFMIGHNVNFDLNVIDNTKGDIVRRSYGYVGDKLLNTPFGTFNTKIITAQARDTGKITYLIAPELDYIVIKSFVELKNGNTNTLELVKAPKFSEE